MNVFRFELKSLRTTTVLWWIGLAILIAVYVSVYPSFSRDVEATKKIFGAFPAAFHAALGFDMSVMFSFLGFLGNIFSVILLAAAIHGASLGVGIFSRERRSRTTDFLLSKPRRRTSLYLSKLTTGLCIIALTTLWVFIVTYIMSVLVGVGTYDMTVFAMIIGVFGGIELWFFAVGALVAECMRKLKTVTPVALSLGFGMFLIGTIGTLIDKKAIRWIAPEKYIDFPYLITHGHYELPYLAVGASIIVVAVSASFVLYTRRDTEVLA